MRLPRRSVVAVLAAGLVCGGIATALTVTAPAAPPRPGDAKASGPVRVSNDLLQDDDPPAQPETQCEPALAVDPSRDATLLAAYEEGRDDDGARAITIATSSDGGKRWSETLLPGLTTASGGSYRRAVSPSVAFGADRRAYALALARDARLFGRNGVFLSSSTDGGRSWGDPVAVHEANGVESDEEPALAVDLVAGSPYRGRVHVAWDSQLADSGQILFASHSDDGGQTFSAPVVLPVPRSDGSVGVRLLVGKGGVVHAIWLSDLGLEGAFLRVARSLDGGDSWSTPTAIAEVFPAGVAGVHSGGGQPSAAIDAKSGALYVAWQDAGQGGTVDQILLATSTDGLSWSAPRRVSDGPADAPSFSPAVAVNAKGQVAVAYYSLRNDPARETLADEYLATSKKGASAFRSRRVTPTSFDLRAAASAGGWFLGEGQGLAGGQSQFRLLFVATLRASQRDPAHRQSDAWAASLAP